MKKVEELKKLRLMKHAELEKELSDTSKKASLERLAVAAGKNQNYSSLSKLRKTAARINTLIAEKSGEKDE
ncbi:MAG: 50S ribosomal protein L29 [Patescibacteria group bacterium]|jgi:ribosomal protein L29